jgi:hypothetical protein
LIFDTDLGCCSEDEDNGWDYNYKDDEDPVQPPLSLSSSSPSSSSSSSTSSSSSSLWGPTQQLCRRSANHVSGGAVGINLNKAPHVNKDSTPLCMFMLFFRLTGITTSTWRVLKTSLPDMTDSEMFLFLGITIQMGHDIRDRLRDYWMTAEQFFASFYSNNLKHGRFLHILCFLHFTDNNAEIDRQAGNYDKL